MSSATALKTALKDYYRLCDAAKAADVSAVTIWRWVRSGKVPYERIGREVLIEKKAIDVLRKS